jgi:hypothetical protein
MCKKKYHLPALSAAPRHYRPRPHQFETNGVSKGFEPLCFEKIMLHCSMSLSQLQAGAF